MSESTLRCSLCKKTFDAPPPGSVKVGQRKGAFQMYLFPDGSAHNLGPTHIGYQKGYKAAKTAEEKA